MTPAPDTARRTDAPDALVLDIGDGIGALVLYTATAALGREIEISREDERRTHTVIRRRRAGGVEFCAGVYPSLPAGNYVVWGADDRPLARVTVNDGQVAELTLTTI